MEGKGQGFPHLRCPGRRGEQQVPTISFDYGFATEKVDEDGSWNECADRFAEDADENMEKMTMLVVKDERSRFLFAHTVEKKGVDEDDRSTRMMVKDIEELGYQRLSVKCDQEPSTMALLRRILRTMNIDSIDQVMHEHPAVGDSQANGSIENGVKTVFGQIRTMRLALGQHLGCRLPLDHPIMSWMTEYAARLLSLFNVGHDGRTAYERLRGKKFVAPIPEFAEMVWAPETFKKNVPREHRGKLRSRWRRAVYLGMVPMTAEMYVWDGTEVKKVRGVRRMDIHHRWDKGMIQGLNVRPWDRLAARAPPRAIFDDRLPGAEAIPAEPPRPQLRDLYVTREDLRLHGFTEGCRKCDAMQTGVACAISHSSACRQRIIEALGPDNPRVQRIIQKLVDASGGEAEARPAERHDEHAGQAPGPPQLADGPSDDAEMIGDDMNDDENSDAGFEEEDHREHRDAENEDVLMAFEQEDNGNQLFGMMEEATADMQALSELVAALGGNPGKHRRAVAKKMKAVVSEVYSPPRVSAMAKLLPGFDVLPGFALDLTTEDEDGQPWDFDKMDQREKARRLLKQQKPMFLIGTSMCTAFSAWQHKSRTPRGDEESRRIMIRARIHLRFVMELYKMQLDEGRYILHEHPAYATAWDEDCTRVILRMPGVESVIVHQCRYGMQDIKTGSPIKKPTRYMSNAPRLLQRLSQLCEGRGGQCSAGRPPQPCRGSTAQAAAIFPKKLCKTILKGMREQMEQDGRVDKNEVGISGQWELDGVFAMEEMAGVIKDDVTGQPLLVELVREARKREMEFFVEKKVYKKVPKGTAKAVSGKNPIPVRWVDVNKGDDVHPEYRSRLVAKHIRHKGVEAVFAAMPPIEAIRTIVSMMATELPGEVFETTGKDRVQLSVIDIKRAYFNAKVPSDDPQFVELPGEDPDHQTHEGQVVQYMYGLQRAAEGWENHYTGVLEAMGFQRGAASPCVFNHAGRRIYLAVYGDDFTARGRKDDLDWYEEQMKVNFELTVKARLGYAPEDDKEARILNRIVRVTSEGAEYEADPRHAEELVRILDMQGCNPTVTPGVKESISNLQRDKPIDPSRVTTFRAAAARCNYLSADRPDCQFASKEVCRLMSKPTERGWLALKRICRYLVGKGRLVHKFVWQKLSCIDVYTDTDWAGCPRTRKSTSGGVIKLGTHTIKTWSSTQALTSLSSGEAEYYGLVKGAAQGLGYKGLMQDFGLELPIEIHCDSAAARGIAKRRGLGKMRHIELQTLWIQEKVARGAVKLNRILGTANPADLFTKHLPEKCISKCLKFLHCELRSGRPQSAPELRAGKRREGKVQECKNNCRAGPAPNNCNTAW